VPSGSNRAGPRTAGADQQQFAAGTPVPIKSVRRFPVSSTALGNEVAPHHLVEAFGEQAHPGEPVTLRCCSAPSCGRSSTAPT
jgi:hypothetical protein